MNARKYGINGTTQRNIFVYLGNNNPFTPLFNMKKILFILLAFTSIYASAQTADDRAADYMNQENWFELQREFTANKDSISSFLQDFGQALLDNFFNRPEAACQSIGKLLNERQDVMGFENTASMILFLSGSLSKLGANDKAADILKNFCGQLEGQVDSNFLAPFKEREQECRVLSEYDLFQWDKPGKDLILPFRTDSVGKWGSCAITLQGSLNGKSQKFTLDTGAGVNVVTPEVANAYGMKMLDSEITANGVRSGNGRLALAEEIRIGDLVMRNVPFYVLDMKTGEEKVDKYMKHLEAIIGLPLMNILQEIRLDFQTNRLTVPHVLTPAPEFAPNISYQRQNILDLEVIYDHERLCMNFDSGSDLSHLNYPYYEHHKERIERIAERDSMGIGGFGGTARVCIYKLPGGGCFQIGQYMGCVDKLDVVATPDENGAHFSRDGVVGMDFFKSFSTITLNLKNMFVQTTPRKQKPSSAL